MRLLLISISELKNSDGWQKTMKVNSLFMGNRYLIVRTKFENYIEQLIMDEFDVNEDE